MSLRRSGTNAVRPMCARLPPAVLSLLIAAVLGACRSGWSTPPPVEAIVRPDVCTGLPPPAEFVHANRAFERHYHSDFSLFQRELTEFVTRYNNLGGARFRLPTGDKVVYRSSILTRNPGCLSHLVQKASVASVVNLYSGTLIRERELAFDEEALFERFGGRSYVHILGFSDVPKPDYDSGAIHRDLAGIVGIIGALPGNVLIHCVGGIHRTGLVFGVLQKCFGAESLDRVVADYTRHAGGVVAGNPEYRPANVEIIRDFDCGKVKVRTLDSR